MANGKNILFYAFFVTAFALLVWFIIQKGSGLEAGKLQVIPKTVASSTEAIGNWQQYKKEVAHNFKQPIALLILQIVTILIVARIFGNLFFKIGQPLVIGEIIAGIFLGPSFLGLFFPEVSSFLFPPESLKAIQYLSQVGLVLFMFIIGLELDLRRLKSKAHTTIVISHVSIVFPYFLGVVLAYFLYPSFAPNDIPFVAFALFMGIAMSITAFPVLARIIRDRNLGKTELGAMALTCAAADDVTAWCILAAVVAIVKAGNASNVLFTVGFSLLYIGAMLYVVKPLLSKLAARYLNSGTVNKKVISFIFILLLSSALVSELIGIHFLFGAFLAGVVMPDKANLKYQLIQKIEDVSLVLLLPLFFVFTGLRTQMGLLNHGNLWMVCALIIALAVIGKFAGSALAARFVGQSWKDSLSIGALMNTRGLMELIVLNIGYDLGILTGEIFAMMVIMALVTTFMTGPALDLIAFFSSTPGSKSRAEIKNQ